MESTTAKLPEFPPELLPYVREQVHAFNEAYIEAAYWMRRCEQILVKGNANPKWVGAVHSRIDDWERNQARHLTALVERAMAELNKTEEKPDAAAK